MHNRRSLALALALTLALTLPFGACTSAPDAKSPPASGTAPAAAEDKAPEGRLPEGVTPLSYALDLEVDPRDASGFAGSVAITLKLDAPARGLWMHALRTTVERVTYTPDGGSPVEGAFTTKNELGLSRVDFPAELPAGNGTLELDYRAEWSPGLDGLYRVKQKDEFYAFTQFEATDARGAFPCFDEPRFKTPFSITVTAPEGMVAIANTQEEKRGPTTVKGKPGKWTTHVYATTEKLPTYLIAFAIGNLDVVEADAIPASDLRERPIPFRGVAAKGRGPELAYALRETPKIVAALESYFGRPYPYDKLDIIAVPDFGAGAMENAGAITFREWLLLVDEKTATMNQKRAFAGVMAHELAHQWFGNLVTMPWWDDLWLNEAFATWMGGKSTGMAYPNYDSDMFSVERAIGAMSTDSLVAARQIRQPIESDHDIHNAFDSITYSKGGGVIAMFERYLGEETFKKGIQQYMARHAFGNATYEDLLVALSDAANKDVATPFKTFLFQPGVPFVEAAVQCSEDSKTASVKLSQSRYLPLGSKGDRDRTWQIPLCLRYGEKGAMKETCTLLVEKEAEVALEGGCPTYLIPNANSAAYVRWTMDAVALRALLEGKADNKAGKRKTGRKMKSTGPDLTARERRGIADAVMVGLSSGRLLAADAIPLLELLAKDPHPKVAAVPLGVISFMRDELVEEKDRAKVEAFARKLYRPVFDKLGLKPRPTDTPEMHDFRTRLAYFLIKTGNDDKLRKDLAKLGRKYLGQGGPESAVDKSAVTPALASVALSAAVMEGDAAFFGAVASRLTSTEDASVRGQVIAALASTRDPALGARAQLMVLSKDLRSNEVPMLLRALFQNPDLRESSWLFMKERFDEVIAVFPAGWGGRLPASGSMFCSEEKAKDVAAFFEPRAQELPGAPRNLAASIESVELCAARAAHHQKSAREYFARAKR